MSDIDQNLREYQTELSPAAGEPTNRRARLDRFGMVAVGSPAGGVGGFHAS